MGVYNQEHTPGRVMIINTNSVTNTSNVFELSCVRRKYEKRQVSKYLKARDWLIVRDVHKH